MIDIYVRNLVGFNTQPPEGGWGQSANVKIYPRDVSTHSRLKAAGVSFGKSSVKTWSFNTQPPEGGWAGPFGVLILNGRFNTQPPEGGWLDIAEVMRCEAMVSTHSRLKAAGLDSFFLHILGKVSTHSRLKAAG